MKVSCAVEVKVAHLGHRIPFAMLEEHQERALKLAAGIGLYWKIEDGTYGEKPFDGFIFCHARAFVAVIWPRVPHLGGELLTVVSVEDWCAEREACALKGEKSLSRERAVALSQLS